MLVVVSSDQSSFQESTQTKVRVLLSDLGPQLPYWIPKSHCLIFVYSVKQLEKCWHRLNYFYINTSKYNCDFFRNLWWMILLSKSQTQKIELTRLHDSFLQFCYFGINRLFHCYTLEVEIIQVLYKSVLQQLKVLFLFLCVPP